MTKFSRFFKAIPSFFFWSLLSGVLVGSSYIPFRGWFLGVCYIPLWLTILRLHDNAHNQTSINNSLKKIFLSGWITQFTLTLIGFNWIYYLSTEFGQLHWSLALGALLSFAAFMHLYIPFSLLLGSILLRKFVIQQPLSRFLVLALTLALFERAWPSIFEWNLAYSLLWMKMPLFQWADTVGFWGLSTWILIFQAILATCYQDFKSRKQRSLLILAFTLFAVALLNIMGSIRGKGWSKNDDVISIGVAQGNIGNAEKVQSEKKYQYHSYIRGIYSDLTNRQLVTAPETELMIWPETAMPFALDTFFHGRAEQISLLTSIQGWGIPLITGGYSISTDKIDHLGYPLTRNAVFYFSPEKKFSSPPYFKTNLLIFGEYMPFGKEIPELYKLLPFVGVYEKGPGPVVAEVGVKNRSVRLGPQICYDSLSPGFSRGLATNGAQIIFNVTNDAWYGDWAEPFQHQLMTLARGIEVRRPLIRATNTGVSSAILADGTQLENSPMDLPWSHTYAIPFRKNPEQTFYTRVGHFDWVVWLLLLIGLIYYSQKKGDHV